MPCTIQVCTNSHRPAFCWKWTQRSVLWLLLLLLLLDATIHSRHSVTWHLMRQYTLGIQLLNTWCGNTLYAFSYVTLDATIHSRHSATWHLMRQYTLGIQLLDSRLLNLVQCGCVVCQVTPKIFGKKIYVLIFIPILCFFEKLAK